VRNFSEQSLMNLWFPRKHEKFPRLNLEL